MGGSWNCCHHLSWQARQLFHSERFTTGDCSTGTDQGYTQLPTKHFFVPSSVGRFEVLAEFVSLQHSLAKPHRLESSYLQCSHAFAQKRENMSKPAEPAGYVGNWDTVTRRSAQRMAPLHRFRAASLCLRHSSISEFWMRIECTSEVQLLHIARLSWTTLGHICRAILGLWQVLRSWFAKAKQCLWICSGSREFTLETLSAPHLEHSPRFTAQFYSWCIYIYIYTILVKNSLVGLGGLIS